MTRLAVAIGFVAGVWTADGTAQGLNYLQRLDPGSIAPAVRHEPGSATTLPPFVSVAPVGKNRVVLASYNQLHCLDLDSGKFSRVTLDTRGGAVARWVPTGVVYHAPTSTLFVANYRANNIIEGLIDCASGRFTVRSVIATANTLGPENVAITSDGALLASANYDGGSVTLFEKAGAGWREKWVAGVESAHAVAVHGDSVYATSLTEGRIYEFDLPTGRLRRAVGTKGWNTFRRQFLWPTSIDVHQGDLLVADAHTGFICRLRLPGLWTRDCFGGNGPYPDYFNMPYGIASLGDSILVTSTFQSRIVRILLETGQRPRVVGDYSSGPTDRTVLNRLRSKVKDPKQFHPLDRKPITTSSAYSRHCELGMPFERYTCDYRGLMPGEGRDPVLALPDPAGITADEYYYFVDAHKGRSGTILFSPQNARLLYYSIKSGVPYLQWTEPPVGYGWKIGDYFVTDNGFLPFLEIEQRLLQQRKDIDQKRRADGALPAEDGIRLLLRKSAVSPDDRARFATKLRSLLASPQGDRFVNDYQKCGRDECDAFSLQKLAREMSATAPRSIEQALLPCMLAGAACY